MNFLYKYQEKFQNEIIYSISEQSFYPDSWMDNDYTIIIGTEYVGLDVDLNHKQIVQVSGLSPQNIWVRSTLSLPVSKEGSIFIQEKNDPVSGTGINYGDTWLTYFDEKQNLICIGNPTTASDDICIEFSKNCYAVIDLNNQLKSIWLKPIFE